MKNGFDQYYDEAAEPGWRERAFARATAIGLQDVDGQESSMPSSNDVINDVINTAENDVIKLNESEGKAIRSFLRNSHISATTLAKEIGVMPRQAQRIMATLKEKAGLRRRGARKNGEWYFEQL